MPSNFVLHLNWKSASASRGGMEVMSWCCWCWCLCRSQRPIWTGSRRLHSVGLSCPQRHHRRKHHRCGCYYYCFSLFDRSALRRLVIVVPVLASIAVLALVFPKHISDNFVKTRENIYTERSSRSTKCTTTRRSSSFGRQSPCTSTP